MSTVSYKTLMNTGLKIMAQLIRFPDFDAGPMEKWHEFGLYAILKYHHSFLVTMWRIKWTFFKFLLSVISRPTGENIWREEDTLRARMRGVTLCCIQLFRFLDLFLSSFWSRFRPRGGQKLWDQKQHITYVMEYLQFLYRNASKKFFFYIRPALDLDPAWCSRETRVTYAK